MGKWWERKRREREQREEVRDLTTRQQLLRSVSRRLLIVTMVIVSLTVLLFAPTLLGLGRFPVSWFCFGLGVIGGFVSIQQRLKKLSNQELQHLESSWVHIMIPPFFGGIFAMVLYLILLSGLMEGDLFPSFAMPDFGSAPTSEEIRKFFVQTYPATGPDFAKLAVWSFLAGFSERLVPDILKRWQIGDSADKEGDGADRDGAPAPPLESE
jgi:hypothetical protein